MLFIALLVGLLVAGVIFEAISARSDRRRFPPPGRLVQMDGLRLHLNCTGTGSPMIVLESGLGDSSLVWADLQTILSARQRVCSYDRLGLAWSSPIGADWSARTAVEQLHRLLHTAGEQPPYVLVGHSAGANYVRLFAHAYPAEVKALVLIEPPIISEFPPVYVAALKVLRSALGLLARIGLIRILSRLGLLRLLYAGAAPPAQVSRAAGFLYSPESIKASLREVDQLPDTIRLVRESSGPGALHDLPLLIIVHDSGSPPSRPLADALPDLARLSARGKVVRVPGSHFVHYDSPAAVASYIEEIIEAAK